MRDMHASNPSNDPFRRPSVQDLASPDQCRMARALLRWTQRDLGIRAAVARKTIGDFESEARTVHFRTQLDITRAFLDAGVVFDESGGARLAAPALVRDGDISPTPAPLAGPNAGNGAERPAPPAVPQPWGRRPGH
jgi:DNA-binding XRE family transcriptional regulator